MKLFMILATLVASQDASATLFKCTLMSKFHGGTVTRLMVGYVNTSDDVETNYGTKLSQIEINARNGSAQPFAAITAYKDNGKDMVVAQLLESKIQTDVVLNKTTGKKSTIRQIVNTRLSDLSEKTVAAVDSYGNSHQVNCFEAN